MTTEQPQRGCTLGDVSHGVKTVHGGRRLLMTGALCVVLAACATASPPPSPAPTPAPSPAPPQELALDTYRAFWRVTDAARSAPRAEDWTPQIEAVASGKALHTALTDIRNYASLPAHTIGTITRTPIVVSATATRVSILDCVDLGDSRLVSDKTGAVLDDLKHEVRRYRLRADVVPGQVGHWLVENTTPALTEPC